MKSTLQDTVFERLNLFTMPVYVVNLDRNPIRLERFEKEAQRIGLHRADTVVLVPPKAGWSRFNAVDGQTMGLSTSTGTSRRSTAYPSPMTAGEIGCYLSHMALWRACALAHASSVAIFEDDVVFAPDFENKFQEFLAALPTDCEAIQFGTSAKGMAEELQPVTEGKLIRHRGGTHELAGCIFSQKALRWIVDHPDLPKMTWPVDGFMHLLQKQFPVYGPSEPLVWQDYAFGSELAMTPVIQSTQNDPVLVTAASSSDEPEKPNEPTAAISDAPVRSTTSSTAKASIGLAMIVKDEAHVIERCLKSVIPLIDSYDIVDTGSSDKTIQIIEQTMLKAKKPGQVVSRPWVDFGHNRTEALALARDKAETSTYTLMIDADDTLRIDRLAAFNTSLAKGLDAYDLQFDDSGSTYRRPQICKTKMPFRYKHPLHEYLACDQPFRKDLAEGVTYVRIGGGGRHKDPNRVDKEIAIFKHAIEKDPNDARSTFYLAQTYYYAWQVENAIAMYEKCLTLWGWTEEKYIAQLHLGQLEHSRGNWAKAQNHYLLAYAQNPQRAEALQRLCVYWREKGSPGWAHVSYLFAREAAQIPGDLNGFIVEKDVHEYKALDEYSIAAYYRGRFEESLAASLKLLQRNVPKEHLARLRGNLEHARLQTSPASPAASRVQAKKKVQNRRQKRKKT